MAGSWHRGHIVPISLGCLLAIPPIIALIDGKKYPFDFLIFVLIIILCVWFYINLKIPFVKSGLFCHQGAFWRGLSLGIILEIALIALYQMHWFGVHRYASIGGDMFMGLYSWHRDPDLSPPFVFVDIDEESVRARDESEPTGDGGWVEDGRVSRGKLAEVLPFIFRMSPSLVIIDVDLSYPSVEKNFDLFEAICEDPNIPTIIAWVTNDPDGFYNLESTNCVVATADTEAKKTGQESGVHWTRPIFLADPDLVVRRWSYCDPLSAKGEFDETCGRGLSVAALAVDLLKSSQEHEERPTETSESDEYRIVYTLPWEYDKAPPVLSNGIPIMTRVSAQILSRGVGPKKREVPGALPLWQGRVVIIGGSFAASQDIHLTPIGPMPGAMIVANAIHSLHQFGVITEARPLLKLLAGFIAILPAAWILSRRGPRWLWHTVAGYPGIFLPLKSVVAGFGVILVTMLVSWALLDWRMSGSVWVDATLPCIGLIIHQWFEEEHPHQEAAHAPPS